MTEALDPKLAEWIGRSSSDADIVTPAMVDALYATLGYDVMPSKDGDQAPQGVHWLCGTQKSRTQDLGADGHTLLGLVLPPVKLPRRMWAGSVIDFQRPIRVGDRIERRSTIRAVTPKQGSAGPLVFVEVERDICASGERALNEVHTIVFRGPPDTSRHGKTESTGHAVNGSPPDIRYTVHPNEVMLFRYSALTFNSHRIHYDYPYVTKVEGYPGLVVHGPLIATLLINAVNNRFGGGSLKRFSFRGVAPAYCNDPLTIEGRKNAEGFALRAVSGDGRLVMAAEASL